MIVRPHCGKAATIGLRPAGAVNNNNNDVEFVVPEGFRKFQVGWKSPV